MYHLVLVLYPKPNPVRITFSIVEVIYAPDELCRQDQYLLYQTVLRLSAKEEEEEAETTLE